MNNNSQNNNQNTEGTQKVPSVIVRKCCACGKLLDRTELIRIMTEYKTGKCIINPDNKQFGKSRYICKNTECLKVAIKKKRLSNLNENDIEILKQLSK